MSSCSRDTFYFEDYSMVKHDGTSWTWAFSPAPDWVDDLNIRNPKVVFGGDGSYDVALTLTLTGGAEVSKEITDMVTLESHCEPDTIPGQALRTLADGDYCVAQDVNLTDITHFTVTGWWKPNGGQPGFGAIFSSGDWCAHCDYTEGLIVDYWGTRLWYKWPGNAANWGSNSGMTIPLDQWSYVALVIEPDGATLYLNEQKYVHNIPLNPGNIESFYLGYGHYSHSFVGDIDEVTIWTRALSESEIRALRHLTKEDVIAGDPDLIAYYQFNALEQNQVLDHAGIHHASLHAGASLTSSAVPIGGGSSSVQSVTGSGEVVFDGTGVAMIFPESGTYPNGDLVVSRLNVPPDTEAHEEPIPDSTYWIVNNYGSNNTFTQLERITFSGLSNINPLIPEVYQLFKRGTNAIGDSWGAFIDMADSATSSALMFGEGNGITSFSQFTLGSAAACVTVMNTNNSGPGSLREAMNCVEAGRTVVFDPAIDGDTIHLEGDGIYFKKDLRIIGRGAANTIIDGSAIGSTMTIQDGNQGQIFGLSLIGGSAESGRAIVNNGDLVLMNVDLYDHPGLPNSDNALILNNAGSEVLLKQNVQIRQE
jgi:PKD repeat protein